MKFKIKSLFFRFVVVSSLISLSLWIMSSQTIGEDKVDEKQSILLFKDNDGLYSYDLIHRQEKLTCKIPDSLVFLDEPYQISGDTLLVGTASFRIDSNHVERYSRYYYAVLPKTQTSHLFSKTSYIVHNRTLTVKQFGYSAEGKEQLVSEKSEPWKSTSGNINHKTYNQESVPRFYSSNTLGDKSVFSYRGSIYLVEHQDTSLLVENTDGFEPKFGRGYFDPQIHPNGEYVLFTYNPGLHFEKEPSLKLVNLKTKKTHTVKPGNFTDPSFSKDGKFVLFSRYLKEQKGNSYQYGIFVLNMSNWKETKIGEASLAYWAN